MTDENQNTDLTEALSLIAVSLGKISQTLENAVTVLQENTTTAKETSEHMKHLAECTEAIADAFYFVDGTAGSVYHMAGSLNSVKHAMPNYAPNPNSKFGGSKTRRRSHTPTRQQPQFEQPIDIGPKA